MASYFSKVTFFTFVCFMLHVISTDAISCYSCGTDTDACENDIKGMLKKVSTVSDKKSGDYFNNCTMSHANFTMCVIEQIVSLGVTKSYIRDCSDGRTFSFKLVNQLQMVLPNNQTVCTAVGGYVQCLTLCNSEDFCNGPNTGTNLTHDILLLFGLCALAITRNSVT